MKKISFVLMLLLLLSLLLSACDLTPKIDDGFYFDGDINLDTSRRPDDSEIPNDEPETGIGDNIPSDLPYLPVA